MISLRRLRQVLDYDSSTGIFRWKIVVGHNASRHCPGEIAGAPRGPASYVQLGIDRRKYYAHRLAWFYVYGVWPPKLDHKDLNKQNNRIKNLRSATTSQNGANAGVRKDSRVGLKGVRKHNTPNPCFSARISTTHLGCFKSAREAHQAYLSAARERWGEFARGKR